MTSMRALIFQQAGWITLGLLATATCASAGPPSPAVAAQHLIRAGEGNAVGAADQDDSFDNLDLVDSSLTGKVGILRVGSEVGENKLLSVFAGLKNKTPRRLDLEIQTIYKDTFGNALNSGSWIPFTIKAHEEKEYRSSSISEQATDFLIRVRRAPLTPNHG